MKVHIEPRESPVYALVVAKNNPKLSPAKDGSCVPFDLSKPWTPDPSGAPEPTYCGMPRLSTKAGVMTADVFGVTMEEFVGRALANWAGRPVIDKTGLTGRYDLHLEFSRDALSPPMRLNGVEQPVPPAPDAGAPSIFTALQEQLGLKLSPEKAPIDVIVVDSAAKPDAN